MKEFKQFLSFLISGSIAVCNHIYTGIQKTLTDLETDFPELKEGAE